MRPTLHQPGQGRLEPLPQQPLSLLLPSLYSFPTQSSHMTGARYMLDCPYTPITASKHVAFLPLMTFFSWKLDPLSASEPPCFHPSSTAPKAGQSNSKGLGSACPMVHATGDHPIGSYRSPRLYAAYKGKHCIVVWVAAPNPFLNLPYGVLPHLHLPL